MCFGTDPPAGGVRQDPFFHICSKIPPTSGWAFQLVKSTRL